MSVLRIPSFLPLRPSEKAVAVLVAIMHHRTFRLLWLLCFRLQVPSGAPSNQNTTPKRRTWCYSVIFEVGGLSNSHSRARLSPKCLSRVNVNVHVLTDISTFTRANRLHDLHLRLYLTTNFTKCNISDFAQTAKAYTRQPSISRIESDHLHHHKH